ncbi:Filament-like plant protein [Macleaya cordata]|uniref:Filament-like plant protein n=1 Tax=Macleaya cordata TaxID=56857 RepID=A0A200QQD7_MACCD|nr:Filament-like plant protein [Macleaya cordata]
MHLSQVSWLAILIEMDRRSWPWKKKSSDKAAEKTVFAPDAAGASFASAGSQGAQENSKKVNYVQISMESYAHLTELEDEVKTLNDQIKTLNEEVNTLNEKLSSANSEMTTKDNLVKQHAKVAEEAVSGWEKAEAEASALKHQLESVTLLKLTAEDRASHLDGALKECMRQIRNVKDEHEKKLHEVILTKTKQWDKIKLELEAKIVDFDQELLRCSAENAAISRSLQERSNMLMKISEEKSQAEAEIELLKENIMSCQKEISSLKYELHISSKELEIRNEEKNMSMRSAEVANKQHLEGVKKIAKLEAECQRLRGLVRKKLPGPAALAQMKLEVENLGRDYGEPRLRRSPGQGPIPNMATPPEISLDNVQQCHKETEFLTSRMLAMEEETKMLKEALTKRNSELQASRNMCAKTASKLRSLESQVQLLHQQRNSPKSNAEMPAEGFSSQNASNPPSLTSMSEDGIDEEGSVAESWATALISELSHFKKERNVDKANKAEMNHLELMDDFLEMERLACLSADSNGVTSVSGRVTDKTPENEGQHIFTDVAKSGNHQSDVQPDLDSSNHVSSGEKLSEREVESNMNLVPLSELQSRISTIFESEAKDGDVGKILEDIKRAVQDIQHAVAQHSVTCISNEEHSADVTGNQQSCPQDRSEAGESGVSLIQDSRPGTDAEHTIDQELVIAVSQIHDFVLALRKEATSVHGIRPDEHGLSKKVEEFSNSVNKVLCHKMSFDNLVLDLSHVLAKASELSINFFGYKGNEGETNTSDCIDKVTLLEKKVVQDDSLRERLPNGCAHISQSASDPEVLREGSLSPGIDLNVKSCKCSFEELEQMKLEKDSMVMDLARCTENLEHTKSQLQETEQLLTELKSQLASSQNSNSLAETQLKCMAESYKSLETRTQKLEAEVTLLREKNETLHNELHEEKQNHQDALAKCSSLQEQIERNDSCLRCSLSSAAEEDKLKKEKEIAAAAEKLAECQETIFLLGKQLKALHPPSEQTASPFIEVFVEDEVSPRSLDPHSRFGSHDFDLAQMENSSSNGATAGPGSPPDPLDSSFCPSETESNQYLRSPVNSKRPKHRPTKSSSSSSSSVLTPEKHSRGFSRFFSTKSRTAQ